MYKNYLKSGKSPKDYAKENIRYNKRYYDNSTSFISDYYSGKRVRLLVSNIHEYRKNKKYNQDELFLSELLK